MLRMLKFLKELGAKVPFNLELAGAVHVHQYFAVEVKRLIGRSICTGRVILIEEIHRQCPVHSLKIDFLRDGH